MSGSPISASRNYSILGWLVSAKAVPVYLFVAALVARLIVWPFADVVDADAVTRALIGESYMMYPGWIGDGVWPPLHFYLSGMFTKLCGGRMVGSVLVNILLGSAIVFPVFAFVKRWSGVSAAIAVTIVIVFQPLVFRNSLQGLAEIPFFFFTAYSFNALAIALNAQHSKQLTHAVLSGVFITLASGMRYEAWLLLPLLGCILLVNARWKELVAFTIPALLFPIIWMLTNHMAQGNMFKGLDHVLHWHSEVKSHLADEQDLTLHAIFFPVSLLVALTPLLVLLGLAGAITAIARRELGRERWPWLILFPTFLLVMINMAMHGELLLQHRFTMTLLLLFVPYISLGFVLIRWNYFAPIIALVVTGWSIHSSFQNTIPWLPSILKSSTFASPIDFISNNTLSETVVIPKLNERWPDELVSKLNTYDLDKGVLILDFLGWQETYNTAFRSDIRATSIVFLPIPNMGPDPGADHIDGYLSRLKSPRGVIVLKEKGIYQNGLVSTKGKDTIMRLPTKELLLRDLGAIRDLRLYSFRSP